MANAWVQHVRAYAKKHNISYMCAISKASKTYKKPAKKVKKVKKKIVNKVVKKVNKKEAIKRENDRNYKTLKTWFGTGKGSIINEPFIRDLWTMVYELFRKIKKFKSLGKIGWLRSRPPSTSVNPTNENVMFKYKQGFKKLIREIKDVKDEGFSGLTYLYHIIEQGEMLKEENYDYDNEIVFKVVKKVKTNVKLKNLYNSFGINYINFI